MSSSLLSRGRSVSPPEDRRDPRAGRREPRRVRVVGREARMEVVSGAAPRRPAPFWRVVTIRTVLIDDRHLTPRIADLHFFLFCILTSSLHRLASLPQVGDNIKGADCNGTISFSQVIFKPHPFNNITKLLGVGQPAIHLPFTSPITPGFRFSSGLLRDECLFF